MPIPRRRRQVGRRAPVGAVGLRGGRQREQKKDRPPPKVRGLIETRVSVLVWGARPERASTLSVLLRKRKSVSSEPLLVTEL